MSCRVYHQSCQHGNYPARVNPGPFFNHSLSTSLVTGRTDRQRLTVHPTAFRSGVPGMELIALIFNVVVEKLSRGWNSK